MTPTQTPPPQAAPRPMTAEEFGNRYSGDHVEYINGQVREIPMAGAQHGEVVNLAAFHLTTYTRSNRLGRVFAADTFVRVPTRSDPQRVYGADVAYVPFALLPPEVPSPKGVLPVTPPLVVEVKSPFDTWTGLFEKVEDYLAAGVAVVVVIDPDDRVGAVHRPGAAQQPFAVGDTLTLPDVLPGFAVAVAELFE